MAHATTRAFADERRAAIMEMLEHNASVQVAEIAQTFGVSSVTARADLDALAESGKLRRTHGGAVSLQKRLTVSTQDRRINVNVAATDELDGALRDGLLGSDVDIDAAILRGDGQAFVERDGTAVCAAQLACFGERV